MKQKGVFPIKDGEFNTYATTCNKYLQTNQARLGINTTALSSLDTSIKEWKVLFPKSQNPDVRTTSITIDKTKLRNTIKTQLKAIYVDIPQSFLVTEDRVTLNLKEQGLKRSPAPVAEKGPGIEMASREGQQHILAFINTIDLTTKQMPAYQSIYLEIFVGAANLAAKDILFSKGMMVTRFKKIIRFEPGDAGKTAYYRATYQNSRGERGPASNVFHAIVP